MAASIQGTINLNPQGLQYLAGDITNGAAAVGSNFNLPNIGFTFGNGAVLSGGLYQVNDWYLNTLTIAGGATYSLNLNGGSDKNPFGVVLQFTAIKFMLFSISTVDYASNSIQVGPQGVANSAQLGFGGTTAVAYWTVWSSMIFPGPQAGWTVNSTTASLLPIKNPGGGSLNVQVFIAGSH